RDEFRFRRPIARRRASRSSGKRSVRDTCPPRLRSPPPQPKKRQRSRKASRIAFGNPSSDKDLRGTAPPGTQSARHHIGIHRCNELDPFRILTFSTIIAEGRKLPALSCHPQYICLDICLAQPGMRPISRSLHWLNCAPTTISRGGPKARKRVVPDAGIEPATYRLQGSAIANLTSFD